VQRSGKAKARVNNLSRPVDNDVNNFCGERGGDHWLDAYFDRSNPLGLLGHYLLGDHLCVSIRSTRAGPSDDMDASEGG